MADDIIDDEFEDDPEDAMFPLFHVDAEDNILFPFKVKVADNQKRAKIMEIIKICYEDPDAFESSETTVSIPKIDSEFFVIKQSEIQKSESILKRQMNVLYPKMADDGGIKKLIAIGHKRRFAYIYLLGDIYSRDIADGIASNMDPGQWLESQPHAELLKSLKASDDGSKPLDIAKAGINGYFNRFCTRLLVDNMEYVIVDSIKEVSKLIKTSINFVNSFVEKNGEYIPLQLDSCIAFGEVKYAQGDDDEDAASVDDSYDEDMKREEFADIIGNVREKLAAHNIKVVQMECPKYQDRETRLFRKAFDKLQAGIGGKFPQNKRFCSFVDRRSEKHQFYIWQAPSDCNEIPSDYKPGWFFNSSSATIIPHEGYKAGAKESSENVFVQNKRLANLMVFSFHVMASDEIRCYMYLNGMMTRFMPQVMCII